MNPVWIIDDDRSIRWVFEKALAREGIAHRTFAAAQEALDQLPEETPQVVVSDIRMPGLSGSRSRASWAAPKVRWSMPSRARAFSNTQRIERSSSIIQTGFIKP